MELEARLRAFAAFVRRRSFVGAAEELRISQPAVSQHIADMERDLGIKLIQRRSRALTPAGEMLASHVLRAEALLTQAAHCVRALRETNNGTLSIIASGTPGTYLLPQVIAEFQQAQPGVHVSFHLETARRAVDAVRSNIAEIGVVGAFSASPEIEAEPLIEDEIVIVGPPQLARKRLLRDEIEKLTWISREEGSGTSALGKAMVEELGIIPQRRLPLPSWEAIKLAVRGGRGIAAISRLAVTEELKTSSLVILPFLRTKMRRTFSIIRIRDAPLTPAAQQFLELLRRRCPKPAKVLQRR
jgi:LysR family transcriptional regulator, transcriptional activator of the cysJI operon